MTSLQETIKWPNEGFSYFPIKIEINLDYEKKLHIGKPPLRPLKSSEILKMRLIG